MSDPAYGSSHSPPPSLPEPRTPLWLPALGAALFSVVGIGWALAPAPPPPEAEAAPVASAAAAAPASAAPAPIPTMRIPPRNPMAMPSGSASAGAVHRARMQPPRAPGAAPAR